MMSIKRDLHFGNTEETYRFCQEEILYMQAVKGKEETIVYLVNSKDYYIIPNGLGYVSKVIDDGLLNTEKSMCRIGRSTIINLRYLNEIGTDTVRLVADIDGVTREEEVKISQEACRKLASMRALTKNAQKSYQRTHFEGGYVERSTGGGSGFSVRDTGGSGNISHASIHSSGHTTGFMIVEYDPCVRPESYYDIDDDQIMFLGV